MNSIESLIGMVLREAIEEREDLPDYSRNKKPKNKETLPPIQYALELLEKPDDSLYWVE